MPNAAAPRRRAFSAALPEAVDAELQRYLVRPDGHEDLLFALYTPSVGARRTTALVHTPVWPARGDRQRHGNASFNPPYFERACREAAAQGCGVAFLHSHPGPGWQGMSRDDVTAELGMAGAADTLTDLPLVGMTTGSDGTWSARAWPHHSGRTYRRAWCQSVRTVGPRLRVDFDDRQVPAPAYREVSRRTRTVWGPEAHATLARLRVGVVGLGSVGMMVVAALARMGVERFVLIDFDEVQPHNLDRLLEATVRDVGRLKVSVARRLVRRSATAERARVRTVAHSVAEEAGYRAALDCDVLFSCVDRPRARQVLNHLAYAHLIPVIDGGIDVRFKGGAFSGADWQLQTATAGRACLECLGAFDPGDADTERAGMLDEPSYMRGLPAGHRLKQSENVFPFSANLASLEVLHLVALVTGAAGVDDFGVQRFRYLPGILEQDATRACRPTCGTAALTAQGDRYFALFGTDPGADRARARRRAGAESGAESGTESKAY